MDRGIALATILADRLEKEVARTEQSTVSIGGITKAGNALEELLRHVVGMVAVAGPRAGRGAGDYAAIILEQSRGRATGNQLCDEIVRELRRPNNRIDRMRALRNRNNHPGTEVRLTEAKDTMAQLARWIRKSVDQIAASAP